VERNDARIRSHRRAAAAGVGALLAGLLTGCAGTDQPGDSPGSDAPASAETAPGAAPAVDSDCVQGVVVDWQGSGTTEDVYTAVKVARVGGDGAVSVKHEWERNEQAGASSGSGVSGAQQAMVDDAVVGGLVAADPAPRLADAAELLEGRDQGKYILYAYARHSTRSGTVSCAGGGESVGVTVVDFDTLQTGAVSCADSPDPVTEFAAAEAISTWCDRG